MAVKFVQFRDPVAVGGDGSISYWSRGSDKHRKIDVQEKGNWVHVIGTDGRRRRVPVTNIVYIEDDEEAKL
jgi:hypothetical protein